MSSSEKMPGEWAKLAPPPRALTGKDQWNVFLSYRSVNRAWVLNLYDVLTQQGHKVFIDQCVLKPGDQLIRRLQDALQTSQSGVLIWSSATADSEWVNREYEVLERLATEKPQFQFVPLRLDNSELPMFARSRVFLDFSSYPDGPNGGELLRLLHALLGQPLSHEAARFALEQDEAAKAAGAKIGAAIRNGDPDRLLQLFQAGGLIWETSSALGCKIADGLNRLGRSADALAVLEKIQQRFPRAVRPKQLYALALARRGQGDDLMNAQEILGELYEAGERDPETLGIYGRTWMDRYAKSGNIGDLRQSRDLYAEAFERAPDDYYTGINAAAKSVLIGTDSDLAKAADYAQRVQKVTGDDPVPGDYWKTATIGEVLLIQKKYSDAARLYTEAVGMARQEIGSHTSTWKQASRLMEKLQPTDAERALVRQAFAHLPD
jgi:tetratricopeptide (TPR) repeat protein